MDWVAQPIVLKQLISRYSTALRYSLERVGQRICALSIPFRAYNLASIPQQRGGQTRHGLVLPLVLETQ